MRREEVVYWTYVTISNEVYWKKDSPKEKIFMGHDTKSTLENVLRPIKIQLYFLEVLNKNFPNNTFWKSFIFSPLV